MTATGSRGRNRAELRLSNRGIRRYPCPTVDSQWQLYDPATGTDWLRLNFYIDEMDGELVPVFEITGQDGSIANRYLVGYKDNVILPSKDSLTPPEALKCPVIIKTSDGDLELVSAQRCLRVRQPAGL